jgi:twitching motility protein PilT
VRISVNEVNLVPSLLQAIVNIDGEALVMHAGDKPYVVSPSGQVELATRGLTLEAVAGIVSQLLPADFQSALDEFGAVQYGMPSQSDFPHEQFTVVVARGGDDVWAEIRRKRLPQEDRVSQQVSTPAAASDDVEPATPEPDSSDVDVPQSHQPEPAHVDFEAAAEAAPSEPPRTAPLWAATEAPLPTSPAAQPETPTDEPDAQPSVESPPPVVASFAWAPAPPQVHAESAEQAENEVPTESAVQIDSAVSAESAVEIDGAVPTDSGMQIDSGMQMESAMETESVLPTESVPRTESKPLVDPFALIPPPVAPPPIHVDRPVEPSEPEPEPPVLQEPAVEPSHRISVDQPELDVNPPLARSSARPAASATRSAIPPPLTQMAPPPAVVLPMARSPIRAEAPPAASEDALSGLERLLRTAAARGASTLYLSTGVRPSIRVDGQIQTLENEPIHSPNDVVSLLLGLMPVRSHEALRAGATTEWTCDIKGVGRVRCLSFADHRGPGAVLRLVPVRTASAEQLALPAEIQALVNEREGLVLVTGPRSSGKRTLIAAFVDLINRSRRDHVITIEREVNIVHERGSSFISQREVRGGDDQILTAARAALREDPDVLVLEEIRTGLLMNVALEAVAAGRLVIGGFPAHGAADSIDRILALYAPEYTRHVQLALAGTLRGIVAQILLPSTGGGRIAARELLLNTPAVAALIADGKTSQLPMAIEGGRRVGMTGLNDAIVKYVQSGQVDVREAYRHVPDRPAFIALLKRQGLDTSAVERLA